MKRKCFTLVLLVSLFAGMARAQIAPSTSTETQPIWYHIGISDANGNRLVCTVENKDVFARAEVANSDAAFDSQLWRFEKDDDKGMAVINKASGQYLSFRYNSTLAITKACITDKPDYVNVIIRQGGFSIKAVTPGIRDVCYLGLTANENLNNLMEELAAEPAPLSIYIYNDHPFKETVAGQEYWYNIVSAKSGTPNMVIHDNSGARSAFPLDIATLDPNDFSQQWMFLKHSDTGLYEIVNRKNSLHILNRSVIQDIYNATQIGWAPDNAGYKIEYIGLGQYSISSVENDGIERMLSMQQTGSEANVYDEKKIVFSPFAWTLREAGFSTGIKEADIAEKIKVENGKIVVDAGKNYTIVNALGISVPKDTKLQKGVYIVIIENHSVKVIIN